MPQHTWVHSTLGHGESMCAKCKVTNREAAALGMLNHCDVPDYKMLATGERACVTQYLFTGAIQIGGTDQAYDHYRTRYCYETIEQATEALAAWDGYGDPPGNWIVQKPDGRYNPEFTK